MDSYKFNSTLIIMEKGLWIITSSDPKCVLGYYSGYKNEKQARKYFENIRRRDPSARLIYRYC